MRYHARFIAVAAAAIAALACDHPTAPKESVLGCYALMVARNEWGTPKRIRLKPFEGIEFAMGYLIPRTSLTVVPDPDTLDASRLGGGVYIMSEPDSIQMTTGDSFARYRFALVRTPKNVMRPAITYDSDFEGTVTLSNEGVEAWTVSASIARVSCSS